MLGLLGSALLWLLLAIGAVGYVLTGLLLASAAIWLAKVNDRMPENARWPLAVVGGIVWPLAIMGICLAVALAVVKAAIAEALFGKRREIQW